MANGIWTGVTGTADGPFDFLHTRWGVLLAEVTYFTPFVMRPLLAAFSQLETAQLEAAASLGAKAPRIVRQVILPEALPALAAGGSLVLVMCLNEFGIVLFTGAKDVTTLPVLIYSRAILDGDWTAACVGRGGQHRAVGRALCRLPDPCRAGRTPPCSCIAASPAVWSTPCSGCSSCPCSRSRSS
ncbi:hypothetical protein GCM10020221_25960 [Streptomyces thioluteus]|uniref:ABC transmembrane type-1 domain-containing protein n=1 Tax=Streptomyces thioluteus TaxID=66431 RepID=A0ABN3WV13_STRTU